MAYAEKCGKGYRARYLRPDGAYGSEPGFKNKTAAKKWGEAEEDKIRRGVWIDPKAAQTRFGDWVEEWWGAQDLAETTMANYETTLNNMILPYLKDREIGGVRPLDVATWRKKLRKAGYAASSIATAHARLHTIMADAVANGLIASNPAVSQRKRGKEEDRSEVSEEEQVWTSPLGALLVAERCGILGGRDEDALFVLTAAYTGMRLGELIGLEKQFCRAKLHGMIRVEWQLVEVRGRFYRRPPKKGSRRDIELPPFLSQLLTEHVASAEKNYCSCTDAHTEKPHEYVFLGPAAGHHRRSNYYRRQFTPAAEGARPAGDSEMRPVYVRLEGEPWPGRPVVGRNNEARAEAAWLAVERRLTPHGLRHSQKTWLIEDGVPEVAQFERLGHRLGGIRGVYSHASPEMRARVLGGLETRWKDSLRQRAEIDRRAGREPHSPVALVDRLLKPWREGGAEAGGGPVVVELRGGRRAMAG